MIPGAPTPFFGRGFVPPEVEYVTAINSGTNASSHNLGNINVTDALNRPRIVVICTSANLNSALSATLGGNAMTVASIQSSTNLSRSIMYRRINPTDTSLNLTITNTSAGSSMRYTTIYMVYTAETAAPTVIAQSAVAATAIALAEGQTGITMSTIYANGGATGAFSTDPALIETNYSAGAGWSAQSAAFRCFNPYASTTVGRPGWTPATQPRTQIAIWT